MKAAGFAIILLAAVVGVIPQFTDCSHDDSASKCHWTARASLASAVPLAVLGGMCGLGRSKSARRSLSVIGAILGMLVILLPTRLIGVCASDSMRCNMIMKPTLIMSGLIVAILCIAMFFKSQSNEESI